MSTTAVECKHDGCNILKLALIDFDKKAIKKQKRGKLYVRR